MNQPAESGPPLPGRFEKSDYVYFAFQGRVAWEKRIVFRFELGEGVPQSVI
jgi:hypothetical protein